jgi:hypothetical protein
MMLWGAYTRDDIEWEFTADELSYYVGVGLRWHPVARL